MDPLANINEQRQLAREILDRDGTLERGGDQPKWSVWDAADRLAELVQALDEWRLKGGFDPYA